MFTVTESVTIDRPVDEVFDFLTDGGNRPKWDASVVSEELTSAGPLGVGSTLHTRQRAMGQEVDFTWRVTRFERPAGMTVVSTSGPLPTTLVFEFAPNGERSAVRATIEGSPTGMMRLAEPLISDMVRTTLATGLARAQALLESTSSA